MAKAIKGDYKIPCGLRQLDTEEMSKYNFIDDFCGYKIYKINSLNTPYDYIVGYYSNNVFKKVAKIYFNKIKDNIYEVDTIYVSEDMRSKGLATKLYMYFIKNHNYVILGSDMQRFGARKLWAKLSKVEDLNVDIIDFKNNIIIENGVSIYHGDLDEEFDERVWSYDSDKKHIRLILKNKIV